MHNKVMYSLDQKLATICREQGLPVGYLETVHRWLEPLAKQLSMHYFGAKRPLLVGINGCQGSGKSTLASILTLLLQEKHQLKTTALSIDDFYLGHQDRLKLAEEVHPLLATRGVPGTHDTGLLSTTLARLVLPGPVKIPRFDKATDNPVPENARRRVEGPLEIVILEGWCVAIPPQPGKALVQAVNKLEKNEDRDLRWRSYVNEQLKIHYQPVFERLDITLMLEAPAFDCVYEWRLEQEEKLAAQMGGRQDNRIMTPEQLYRFIQHYQRLTTHALEVLPGRVNYLFELDEQRQITRFTTPNEVRL